jgi:monoamine oxidase
MSIDVIVIGAGVSGLACATRLTEAGVRAMVVEARPRIGGRILTFRPADGGSTLELGAQVVHGDRNPALAIVKTETAPRPDAAVIIGRVRRPMGLLARSPHPPWLMEARLNSGGATDDATVGAWLLDCGVCGTEYQVASEWFRQTWATDPTSLSARGIAEAHRGDSGGPGEFTVKGGFDRLPQKMAEGLEIRCDRPVQLLDWSPGKVRARTPGGTLEADRVVVTVPPAVVAHGTLIIENLPGHKVAAAQSLASGDGFCAVVTLSVRAPETTVVFDADGTGGFISCRQGRPEVLIVAKDRAAGCIRATKDLLAPVAVAFTWVRGARVLAAEIADWGTDKWSRGAFTAPRIGAESAAADWAEPVGDTLFFAGEATVSGTQLPWIQGAIASGGAAAARVLEAMYR